MSAQRPHVLRRAPALACWVLLLSACGSAAAPSNIATNPAISNTTLSGNASPTALPQSSTRTVLSPLGLNIHANPDRAAPVIGTAAQGVSLSVLASNPQNGGWYRVQGQTITGWIVADPSLSASGLFAPYQSSDRMFNVLYPQDWTFAEEAADVLFHPIAGPQTIVVRNAAQLSALGPAGAPSFTGTAQETVVVCGVTGDVNEYTHAGAPPPTPAPGTAGPLALFAQLRLRLDASHALGIDFNYTAKSDLARFADFYNSLTFPFPACQAAPAASPSPT